MNNIFEVKTYKGETLTVDIEKVALAGVKIKAPHWFWWVLLTLVFFPLLIILVFMIKSAGVVYHNNLRYELEAESYKMLEHIIRQNNRSQ